MIKSLYLILFFAFIQISIAAAVEETDVEAEYTNNVNVKADKKLKQNITLGFSNTSGNTETLNVNGKYDASFTTKGYQEQELKIAFDTSVYLSKNNRIKDNEEYLINLGMEQYINKDWLGYTSINWLRNVFLNYDNKLSIGAGVGRELFNNGKHSLKMKLGFSYNIEEYSNQQSKEKFTSLNEYIEYNNKLNDVSNFYLKIGAMENLEEFSKDYQLLTAIGFNFTVAENLNLTIAEELRYDKRPPIGFETIDTKSIVRLGYQF